MTPHRAAVDALRSRCRLTTGGCLPSFRLRCRRALTSQSAVLRFSRAASLPSAFLPTAVLNFDAVPPCEVMDRGHMALTPLILTQPSRHQETATVGGQNGLGLEEAEAMDMER